jgi:hypothetical protein
MAPETRGRETVTEYRQFMAMLDRAGIGHGLREDRATAVRAVMVETGDDDDPMVTEFWFDAAGNLMQQVPCYASEEG